MKIKRSKNELHFLFIPNILHNICIHFKAVKDVRNLERCHRRIGEIMIRIPISIGLTLKDPLCRRTNSLKRLYKIIRHMSPNWNLLYIVFDFGDHCPLCNFKQLQTKCRSTNMSRITLNEDALFAENIQSYDGKLYCAVYRSDELVEQLLDADFGSVYQTLKSGCETKAAKHIITGSLIQVPPIQTTWLGHNYGYITMNGVLTL